MSPPLPPRTYPYEGRSPVYPSVRRAPLVGHVVVWDDQSGRLRHGKVIGVHYRAAGTEDEVRVLEVWDHHYGFEVQVDDTGLAAVASTPLCPSCPPRQEG